MTNKQIFLKAVNKAIKKDGKVIVGYLKKLPKGFFEDRLYYNIIFDHYFAELFWGSEWEDGEVTEVPMSEILELENIKPWQHHLRKMILVEEPLLYLKKFL